MPARTRGQGLFAGLLAAIVVVFAPDRTGSPDVPVAVHAVAGLEARALDAVGLVRARLDADRTAMERYRPGYRFWRHVFTSPDGSIAFGRGADGRLIATFPSDGDWTRGARWADSSLAPLLAGRALPARLSDRREVVAQLLAAATGPVLHNPTRGGFLLPNALRYGDFLSDWGAIYERFAVPAEIGLAQAAIESGLNGTIRSEARAIGFCQWLSGNWDRLKRLAPNVIEGHNQTTQAPYCAAYLSILATKYGSFIPALSEHHTGGANTGRTIINGERLGGADVRERYFLGAELARDLRALSPGTYRDVYGTYGPRSFLYTEMVFGNIGTIVELRESRRQSSIFAMRTTRALTLAAIARRTALSADDIRRFNPALRSRVPAHATLYLPVHVEAFGRDVAFWHRLPTEAYTAVLGDFVALRSSPEAWDAPAFDGVLRAFRDRFLATRTEEGTVMATTLAFVLEDRPRSRQAQILAEFRSSARLRQLFERARLERDASRPQPGSGGIED